MNVCVSWKNQISLMYSSEGIGVSGGHLSVTLLSQVMNGNSLSQMKYHAAELVSILRSKSLTHAVVSLFGTLPKGLSVLNLG